MKYVIIRLEPIYFKGVNADEVSCGSCTRSG